MLLTSADDYGLLSPEEGCGRHLKRRDTRETIMTGQELQELLDSIDTDDPSNFGAVFRILMFEAKPALERGDVDAANAAMESAAIVALAFDRAHNTTGSINGRRRRHYPVEPDPDAAEPVRAGTLMTRRRTACVPTRLLRACVTARKRL